MVFSSPRFLIFLVAVLLLLMVVPKVSRKKHLLAVASCFFYAAWDFRYLLLLLAVSFIDYYCAAKIDASFAVRTRKLWLTCSIVSNLGILGYFKYYNFFIDNLNGVLSTAGWFVPHASILLPAGISFYTFKSMSYTIDVYRREIETCKSQIDYTTFVTFFPELIAGPIVRASVFLPQMSRSIGPTVDRLAVGGSLFLLGLTKKSLVADRLAVFVDEVFARPVPYSGVTLWLGVFAYALQIYCDFSGYSDMAIGTAKMIGYDLPENFNMPYLSANITEFWRRWHITLSSWLRDYLYIPLGGNRRGKVRTYVNLTLTMLLGGLWHGASWNFVVWGLLHGVALAVHKLYRGAVRSWQMPSIIAGPLTFLFVILCWIPFRSPSFATTALFFRRMFSFADGALWIPDQLVWLGALVVVGHVLGSYLSRAAHRQGAWIHSGLAWFSSEIRADVISSWYVTFRLRTVPGAFLVSFWLVILFFFVQAHGSPFIYFQF